MSSAAERGTHDQDTYERSDTGARKQTGSYEKRVSEAFAELDRAVPDSATVERIAEAALNARWIFYAAATYTPSEIDLDGFFALFVRQCIVGSSSEEPSINMAPSGSGRKRPMEGVAITITNVIAA